MNRLAGVAFIAVTSFMTACAGDGHVAAAPGDPTSSGVDASASAAPAPRTSDVRLLLTDAPATYDHVWVDLAEIDAHSSTSTAADPADGGAVDPADGGTDSGGWLTISVPKQRVDLLTLQNGATMDLGGATIPAGAYDNLRFIVTGGTVTVGGVDSDLKIPSGARTGIKVPLGATFDADVTTTLTLDFDAARSVVAANGSYLLKPVIVVKSRSDEPRTPSGR